jgi:hypothetical protein
VGGNAKDALIRRGLKNKYLVFTVMPRISAKKHKTISYYAFNNKAIG